MFGFWYWFYFAARHLPFFMFRVHEWKYFGWILWIHKNLFRFFPSLSYVMRKRTLLWFDHKWRRRRRKNGYSRIRDLVLKWCFLDLQKWLIITKAVIFNGFFRRTKTTFSIQFVDSLSVPFKWNQCINLHNISKENGGKENEKQRLKKEWYSITTSYRRKQTLCFVWLIKGTTN